MSGPSDEREAAMQSNYDAAIEWLDQHPDYRGYYVAQGGKVIGIGPTRKSAYSDARNNGLDSRVLRFCGSA